MMIPQDAGSVLPLLPFSNPDFDWVESYASMLNSSAASGNEAFVGITHLF